MDRGVCVLEWEDSPSHSQIDMVVHCYHKQYPMSAHMQFISLCLIVMLNMLLCHVFLFSLTLYQVHVTIGQA